MSATTFHVITAVWGDDFIDLFLTIAIPNQLSTGNLASLPQGSRYRIFTSDADRARLEDADAVRAMQAVLPVDIVVVDDGPTGNAGPDDAARYDQMIRYHRRAVEGAFECGAALIFLSPDLVLATHTMTRLVDLRAQGYRAVVCSGIGLSKESMLAALAEYGPSELPPRTLVQMALPRLHPLTLEHLADARRFSHYPSFVCWRVDDSGLLVRFLTLHPLMIDPARAVLPTREIDGNYLWQAVPDLAMVYVVTDSDDLVLFEMTTTRAVVSRATRTRLKLWRTAGVAIRCDPHQLSFWQRPVRFHGTDLSPAWTAVERESRRFADGVSRRLPYARRLRPLTNRIRRWRQRYEHHARHWRRRLPRIRLKQLTRPVVIAIHRARKRLRRGLR